MDEVRNLFAVNIFGVMELTQAFLNLLIASGNGRIVNIGSIDGLRVPTLETFAYSSSKAGLHHLSRVLADHLGKRGIT